LFTECGHSSRLEGGAPGALRELIDRQLYVLKCICRAIGSVTPNRVVLTSSCTALEFLAFRSIRAATYISHALTVRQFQYCVYSLLSHENVRLYMQQYF
jgi:hypothetical protein